MQTERLDIRRFRADDWQALHAYLSDPEVVRYEPYAPLTPEACRDRAAQFAISEDFWAVCLRGGDLIGNVYLARGDQDTWELGYVFSRAHQGQGYATEAARALLDDIFRAKGAHRVFAQCNPENVASWRLLERLHLRREGHLHRNVYFRKDESGAPLWQDTYLYAILREEWMAGMQA